MKLKKTSATLSRLAKRHNNGQFQKGNMPHTTVYGDDQVIRVRYNHKRNLKSKFIRTGFRTWQPYQHYLWEKAHGPVQEGHVLCFINGDSMDCRLENLRVITMAENALRNSGSLNLSDGYVAHTLAWHDPELKQEMLQHPELIELKRTQLLLKRAIQNDNAKPAKTGRMPKRDGRQDVSR